MENQQDIIEFKYNEKEKTRFYWWGVTFLLLGGAYFMVTTCIYLYQYSTNPEWISSHLEYAKNAIEVIVSGSGLCASLAGVFYVLDNLTLQRKAIAQQQYEIKQNIKENRESNTHYETQSGIMRLQQNDNTFFNLIELHKKLYVALEGEDFFNITLSRVLQEASRYVECINTQHFTTFYETRMNPRFYCSPHNFSKSYNFEFYINNVKEVVYFIHQKLGNDTFYHKILYNVLFPNERYIIGMAQKLELFDFYIEQEFKNNAYDYAKHYDSINSYQFYKGYFPMLSIEVIQRNKRSHKSNVNQNAWGYEIKLLENYLGHKLKLTTVYVFISLKDDLSADKKQHRLDFNVNKELQENILFGYELVVKTVVGYNHNGNYELYYNFVFDYNNTLMTVSHYEIVCINSDDTIQFVNSII